MDVFGEATNARAANGVADRIVNQRRRPFAETRGRRNDLTRLPFVTARAVRTAGDKKSPRRAEEGARVLFRLATRTARQLSSGVSAPYIPQFIAASELIRAGSLISGRFLFLSTGEAAANN